MSFQVKLYRFAKKRNSTAQPPEAAPVTVSGNIKEDFSPLAFNMTFDLGTLGNRTIPEYNYAYVQDFKRYYYITDWVFVSGLWRAALTVDVLASYKTDILASNQYVSRSASRTRAGVIDTAEVVNGGSNMITADQTMTPAAFWGTGFEDGTIVVGVIGNSGASIGAVTYYAMAIGGFQNLMHALLDDINWANISVSEISQELQKALINPAQYIVSCIWIPKNAIDFVVNSGAPTSDIVTDIKLGWWSFSISAGGNVARILHNPLSFGYDWFEVTRYFEIDKHPQNTGPIGGVDRAWLQLSPYSRYTLTFLPFGSFDLDTTELYNYAYLQVRVRVHAYTGDAVLQLSACTDNQGGGAKVITTLNANCGVPLPIGQIALNIGNMDSALTSAAIMGATEIAQDLSSPSVVSALTGESGSKPRKTSPHSTSSRRGGR